MADRPIAFSDPMRNALFAGRKTQTRRLLQGEVPPSPSMDAIHPKHVARHPAPYLDAYCGERRTLGNPRGMSTRWCWWTRDDRPGPTFKVPCAPGDRLWVRESYYQRGYWEPIPSALTTTGRQKFRFIGDPLTVTFDAPPVYRKGMHNADPGTVAWHKRLARFMPRSYSRMTLLVTDVRVQRLGDISEEDAVAEGAFKAPGDFWSHAEGQAGTTARASFAVLWTSINGPGAWLSNPVVAAVGFSVHHSNIDALQVAA